VGATSYSKLAPKHVIAVVLYTALTLIPSASEDRRALAAARASSPA
jgi:hypothetical protein